MDEKDKKEYELAVLVANEADVAPVVALMRQHNGEIVSEPRSRKVALAYEIKKHREAFFAYCTFRVVPEDAKNLERDLNTKAEVIRSLVIASPAPAASGERQAAPSPLKYRTRVLRPASLAADAKPAAPRPLSNEALEKKIEEILQ